MRRCIGWNGGMGRRTVEDRPGQFSSGIGPFVHRSGQSTASVGASRTGQTRNDHSCCHATWPFKKPEIIRGVDTLIGTTSNVSRSRNGPPNRQPGSRENMPISGCRRSLAGNRLSSWHDIGTKYVALADCGIITSP